MLKREQDRLYRLLPACLLRVSRMDDCMWVCDLPRRMENVQELEEKLRENGFACSMDEKSRMWQIDWTESKWNALLADLPSDVPEMPADDGCHAAYALCRLWLAHPGQRTKENLPLLRRVIKLTAEKESLLLKAVPEMHQTAALHLRTGVPSAHDAGRVLAKWLNERGK